MAEQGERDTRRYLLGAFWDAALGFWRRGAGPTAWMLTGLVVVLAFVNLALQYRLNVWNRAMFDALDHKDGSGVLRQSLIFLPLTIGSVGLAAASVYARMTAAAVADVAQRPRARSLDQQRPLLPAQSGPG
jgi:putative ATP-binding cassette transporter